MNRYNFKAIGALAVNLSIKADYVYFRSGTMSGGAVDDTIIVQSAGGGESMILQPGQGCPFDSNSKDWLIYNASGVGTIDGVLLFGKGPFTDNRPSGQTAVVGTVKTQETGMQYASSYAANGTDLMLANTNIVVVAPAANIRGIVVHQSMMWTASGAGGIAVLLAKAAAPASTFDGDLLNAAINGNTAPSTITTPVLVGAGKGLYLRNNAAETNCLRSILYSVL